MKKLLYVCKADSGVGVAGSGYLVAGQTRIVSERLDLIENLYMKKI